MKKIGIMTGLAAFVLVLASCGKTVSVRDFGDMQHNNTVPVPPVQETSASVNNNYTISLSEEKRVKEAKTEDGQIYCNAVWYDLYLSSENSDSYPLLRDYLARFNGRNEANITNIYNELLISSKDWMDSIRII